MKIENLWSKMKIIKHFFAKIYGAPKKIKYSIFLTLLEEIM